MGFTIGILANRLGFAIGRTIFKAVGVMCRVLPFTHGTVLVMATLLSAAAGVATIVLYCIACCLSRRGGGGGSASPAAGWLVLGGLTLVPPTDVVLVDVTGAWAVCMRVCSVV